MFTCLSMGILCLCLNAPFGAQCFPTRQRDTAKLKGKNVSMHLLVLSAFRRRIARDEYTFATVSMHLLVLSAFRRRNIYVSILLEYSLNAPFGAQCFPTPHDDWPQSRFVWSQCTFWCSVLSDLQRPPGCLCLRVSMHLLVLSAFRLS